MYTLKIGRRSTHTDIATVSDAQAIYATARNESGEGMTTFPDGKLTGGDQPIRLSYNGRAWIAPGVEYTT